jgi:hypothetical protein
VSDRVAPRRVADECPWITGVRLSQGGEAALVNISWSGLMARCPKRLLPGAAVTVTFSGTFSPSVVRGRVARCEVGGIGPDGSIHYKIGIGFDEPISLPDEDRAPTPEPELLETASQIPVENRW